MSVVIHGSVFLVSCEGGCRETLPCRPVLNTVHCSSVDEDSSMDVMVSCSAVVSSRILSQFALL